MSPFSPQPGPGRPPFVIAHRGISAKAPENTLASFSLAVQSPGIDMIELDARLTKDEEVIVLHDRTLQRTSTGNGIARKFSLTEIGKYDAGSWFNPKFTAERIPTLKQVLALVGQTMWVNIEIKSDPFHREPRGLLERKVLDVVHECGAERSVFFSSFDHQLIAELKHMAPAVETGVLFNFFRDFGRLPSKLVRRANASAFICGKTELRPVMLQDAKRHNIPVYIYTLNSVKDAQKMLQLGVQGIISDCADDIVPLINGRGGVN